MDNFEWINGCGDRFGLAHVDFKTEKRRPKLSASDRLRSAFGPAAMGERERTITKGGIQMRWLAFALVLAGAVTAARAQDAIPDLKGTWSGKGKSIVFGNNAHHPGSQAISNSPRVRDFEFTFVVDGQEGRLAWGHYQRAFRLGYFG
jgi:hypothetical protein